MLSALLTRRIQILAILILMPRASIASEAKARNYIARAEAVIKAKQIERARTEFENAIKMVEQLSQDNLARAEIKSKAARYFLRINESKIAASLLRDSVKQVERIAGKNAARLGELYTDMTRALLFEQDFSEAEISARRSLELNIEVLGANHAASIFARTLLAKALSAQKKVEQAEVEHLAIIDFYERTVGKQNPEIIPRLLALAQFYHGAGILPGAEREYARIIKILSRDKLGRSPVEVASIFSAYADVLGKLGNKKEAKTYRDKSTSLIKEHMTRSALKLRQLEKEGELEQALELAGNLAHLAAQILGMNNTKALEYILAYARLVSIESDGKKGTQVFKNIEAANKDNGSFATALSIELANHYLRSDNFDAARETIQNQLRGLSADRSLPLWNELGVIELKAKNYKAAIDVYERMIPRLRELGKDAIPMLQKVLIRRAQAAKGMGNFKSLKHYMQQAKELYSSSTDSPVTQQVLVYKLMASYYIDDRNFDAALKELTEVLKIYGAAFGPKNIQTIYTLVDIAKIFIKQEKYRNAMAILDRASHTIEAEYGSESIARLDVLNNLGIVYLALERNKDAVDILRSALRLARKHRGNSNITPKHIARILIGALRRIGLTPEADELAQEFNY